MLIVWNALCSPLLVRYSAIEMTTTVINIKMIIINNSYKASFITSTSSFGLSLSEDTGRPEFQWRDVFPLGYPPPPRLPPPPPPPPPSIRLSPHAIDARLMLFEQSSPGSPLSQWERRPFVLRVTNESNEEGPRTKLSGISWTFSR